MCACVRVCASGWEWRHAHHSTTTTTTPGVLLLERETRAPLRERGEKQSEKRGRWVQKKNSARAPSVCVGEGPPWAFSPMPICVCARGCVWGVGVLFFFGGGGGRVCVCKKRQPAPPPPPFHRSSKKAFSFLAARRGGGRPCARAPPFSPSGPGGVPIDVHGWGRPRAGPGASGGGSRRQRRWHRDCKKEVRQHVRASLSMRPGAPRPAGAAFSTVAVPFPDQSPPRSAVRVVAVAMAARARAGTPRPRLRPRARSAARLPPADAQG